MFSDSSRCSKSRAIATCTLWYRYNITCIRRRTSADRIVVQYSHLKGLTCTMINKKNGITLGKVIEREKSDIHIRHMYVDFTYVMYHTRIISIKSKTSRFLYAHMWGH